jgi:hypothetical protein
MKEDIKSIVKQASIDCVRKVQSSDASNVDLTISSTAEILSRIYDVGKDDGSAEMAKMLRIISTEFPRCMDIAYALKLESDKNDVNGICSERLFINAVATIPVVNLCLMQQWNKKLEFRNERVYLVDFKFEETINYMKMLLGKT